MSAFECTVEVNGRAKELDEFVNWASLMDGDSMSVIDDIEISERVKNVARPIVNMSFVSSVLDRDLLIEVVEEWSQIFRFLKFELYISEPRGTDGDSFLTVEDGMATSVISENDERFRGVVGSRYYYDDDNDRYYYDDDDKE